MTVTEAKARLLRRKRRQRMGEILLAYGMIAFGLFLGWRCLFDPTFYPQIRPEPRPAEPTLEQFIENSCLDPNTATREELLSLPGIGEVLADRIIAYRREHGGFATLEELTRVSGIGEKKLAELESYLYIEAGEENGKEDPP